MINYAKFGTEENKNGSVNHDYFGKIIVNAENLLNFMKNILELQRINNKIEIQKHVISFYELEKEVKSNYEDIAKAKGIDFETILKCEEKAVYVRGNLKLIKQILFNLLNNSFKYTHVGGRVSLTMETTLKRGLIEEKYIISDNGIGISKEFQKKMYEPFNVGNEEVSAESKMGIGLSICKKTIEKLNGKIKCESEVSNGTIFTVTIKEEIPNKKEIEEYLARKKDEEKFEKFRKNKPKDSMFKILVCEDSIINAKILKKILENANYEFEWAKNGEVAVSRFKNKNFDLVLMDFKMPIMSGFEASEEIRKFDKVIPIIGLSGSSSEEYEKAFRAGMNECLEKPIDKNKLLSVIKKFTS